MKKYLLGAMLAAMLGLIMLLLLDFATIESEQYGAFDPNQFVQSYTSAIKQRDQAALERLCFEADKQRCGIGQKIAQYGGYDLAQVSIVQQPTEKTSRINLLLTGQMSNQQGQTQVISDVMPIKKYGDRWFFQSAP